MITHRMFRQAPFGCGLQRRLARGKAGVLQAGVLLLGISGCGGESLPLQSVTGEVRLDDQPLAGALVEFSPLEGAPSYGETDDAGRYRLRFSRDRPGALIGEHRVRIQTGRTVSDDQGQETVLPERLPARYHRETELTATVNRDTKSIDFDLKSK